MKIIDLLNKIANGEKVPRTIKYKNEIRQYVDNDKDYTSCNSDEFYLFYGTMKTRTGAEFANALNDEVEIIEDKPKEDKKIEKLDLIFEDKFIKKRFKNGSISYLDTYTTLKMLYEKQCEIIDKINGE